MNEMKIESNKEQLILEAAEIEFLEKGYKNAATTAIAKRAGVTHALLHYYFRTKENLFQKVFQSKIRMVGDSFYQNLVENLPFEKTIRNFIESHFDFVRQNPKIVNFVQNEILNNKENRHIFFHIVRPKIVNVLDRFDKLLTEEVSKGKIKSVKASDLLINIVAMNVTTFMVFPIVEDLIPSQNSEHLDNLINERKESNVQFVLNALRV